VTYGHAGLVAYLERFRREGQEAKEAGLPLEANPYREGDTARPTRWTLWQEGWNR